MATRTATMEALRVEAIRMLCAAPDPSMFLSYLGILLSAVERAQRNPSCEDFGLAVQALVNSIRHVPELPADCRQFFTRTYLALCRNPVTPAPETAPALFEEQLEDHDRKMHELNLERIGILLVEELKNRGALKKYEFSNLPSLYDGMVRDRLDNRAIVVFLVRAYHWGVLSAVLTGFRTWQPKVGSPLVRMFVDNRRSLANFDECCSTIIAMAGELDSRLETEQEVVWAEQIQGVKRLVAAIVSPDEIPADKHAELLSCL